jgi:hypothetical protein
MGRNILMYFAWSRPDEEGAPLGDLGAGRVAGPTSLGWRNGTDIKNLRSRDHVLPSEDIPVQAFPILGRHHYTSLLLDLEGKKTCTSHF